MVKTKRTRMFGHGIEFCYFYSNKSIRKKAFDMGTKQKLQSKSAVKVENNDKWYPAIFIFLIILLYGRTVGFEFALDDGLFIVNNPMVQKGISGIHDAFSQGSMMHFKGGNFQIYRPAQISLFCIEQQLFGFTPGPFHFINILLYILISITIYKLLKLLLPNAHHFIPFLITIIFIVHPIHTEVVANIKSQDELLSAVCNLSALYFFLKYDVLKNKKLYMASIILFNIALFSKESSIAFLVIFPAASFMINRSGFKKILLQSLPHLISGLCFLLCRHMAIKDVFTENETTVIENVLYGAKDAAVLWGTKLEILFYYIKMMIFPYPMSWDYSFNQIPLVSILSLLPILSLTLYGLMGILFLLNLKKRPLVSFGIFFFVVLMAPTSNLFFLNGATFADRFLFLPSFGFILAAFILIYSFRKNMTNRLNNKPSTITFIWVGCMIVVFSSMTINRNSDWRNDEAVFRSGAKNSPNSSRTTAGMGTYFMNMAEAETSPELRKNYIDSSLFFFKRSLEIYTDNSNASYKLGLIYSILNDKTNSIYYYRKSIQSKPDNVQALNNIGAVYASMNRFDSAAFFFQHAFQSDSLNEMTLTNLCIAYINLNDYKKTIDFGEIAERNNKGNKKIYNIMSLAFEKTGNIEQSKVYSQKSSLSSQ